MQRIERLRLVIRGAVQGVGFRPFVYRLAVELGLRGWVGNWAGGVTVETEGAAEEQALFRRRLEAERPINSSIHSIEVTYLDPVGYRTFEIKESTGGPKTTIILPDIATCRHCLEDISDPNNRRYRYPFTNCTNCGPRFSIILGLPYDRPNTTMRGFSMCDRCLAEYHNPADRRFHAQPNACPKCGPFLQVWDRTGRVMASGEEALQSVEECLRAGQIAAVKGLGGFLLMLDARNQDAIARLREFKGREEKPFALMFPSSDLLKEDVEVSESERLLLESPACPIVLLLRKKNSSSISSSVAPGNPYWGVMLPYTPLHHLLLSDLGFPLVATSGNLKDEPICTDEGEALARLGSLAELFLVHNRPIARPVDDSVGRIVRGRESILRRARGYAPLPVAVQRNLPTILALGGHLKSTLAFSVSDQVFLSQHLGDLETEEALDSFRATKRDLLSLYDVRPRVVACDLHPNYLSTQEAKASGLEIFPVQHHYAHVLSCMAEYGLEPPVLGVSWDGTGFGPDGTIWGGESLEIREHGFHRLAHLRPFRLPGGEAAVKEPRRSALGVLWAIYGEALFTDESFRSPFSTGAAGPLQAFSTQELKLLRTALVRQVNSPITSSAGRLFDAVASLTGIRQLTSFEGQAAMELEFASLRAVTDRVYRFDLVQAKDEPQPAWWIDWEQTVTGILADLREGITRAEIGRTFHNTLCAMLTETARKSSASRVVLSGGCFQNLLLVEGAIRSLRESGFQVYWHQRIPPNDGGLAVGQLMAAARDGR